MCSELFGTISGDIQYVKQTKKNIYRGTLQTLLSLCPIWFCYDSALVNFSSWVWQCKALSPWGFFFFFFLYIFFSYFAQQHLNISWNRHRLQCYRDVCGTIQMSNTHWTNAWKGRRPPLCSACWCQYLGGGEVFLPEPTPRPPSHHISTPPPAPVDWFSWLPRRVGSRPMCLSLWGTLNHFILFCVVSNTDVVA